VEFFTEHINVINQFIAVNIKTVVTWIWAWSIDQLEIINGDISLIAFANNTFKDNLP